MLAARIRIKQVIQHLHQGCITESHLWPQKTRVDPRFRVFAKSLQEASADVMNDNEQSFIHECLQNCL